MDFDLADFLEKFQTKLTQQPAVNLERNKRAFVYHHLLNSYVLSLLVECISH